MRQFKNQHLLFRRKIKDLSLHTAICVDKGDFSDQNPCLSRILYLSPCSTHNTLSPDDTHSSRQGMIGYPPNTANTRPEGISEFQTVQFVFDLINTIMTKKQLVSDEKRRCSEYPTFDGFIGVRSKFVFVDLIFR